MRQSCEETQNAATTVHSLSRCYNKMFERRKYRRLFVLMLFIFICGLIYLGYFMCEDRVCVMGKGRKPTQFDAYLNGKLLSEDFKPTDLQRDYNFDIEGNEVLVFLHIQKTGGTTFGKHLVRNIDLEIPCECYKGKKKCDCQNSKQEVWLFSRYSTGWMCGLHADWTELQACVNEMLDRREPNGARKRRYNRYLYITMLRDPVFRYLSEWRHVQRGSTWLATRLKCNGREATLDEVPFCFNEEDWSGVSLGDFMACPHNLANNRQARMLANLSEIGCYNKSVFPDAELRDRILLQSAKDNLRAMAFFGLTEFQADTQYMFEKTFHLKFIEDFVQHNATHANLNDISDTQKRTIHERNRLDIEVYQYAKELFFQRLKRMRDEDRRNGVTAGSGGAQKHSAPGDNRGVVFNNNVNSYSNNKRYTDIHKYDVSKIEEEDEEEDYEDMQYSRRRSKHSKYT